MDEVEAGPTFWVISSTTSIAVFPAHSSTASLNVTLAVFGALTTILLDAGLKPSAST